MSSKLSDEPEARCEKCGQQRDGRGASKILKRSGFTLIELIFVIAIIAILAALLLPALVRAKVQAQSAYCKNNLHQIGLAAQMYLADFRHYPIDWDIPLTTIYQGETLESGSLRPYLAQQRKVFYCPVQEDCPIRLWVAIGGDDRLSGYALNNYGTADSAQFVALRLGLGVGSPPVEVEEGNVRRPADMIAYGDCFTGARQLSPHGTNQWNWDSAVSMPSARHSGGANVLFCEGHVEFHKQAEWIRASDNARARWNNDHQPHPETW